VASAALVLFIVVDLLGILGAVLVAVPFLREFALKRLLDALRQPGPPSGMEDIEQAAAQAVQGRLAMFKPSDGLFVGWGLLVIAVSYLLHIVAEILEHMTR